MEKQRGREFKVIIWREAEVEVGKPQIPGRQFLWGSWPSAILSVLPTYFSLFWCKNAHYNMFTIALHNIPSCKNLISTRQLGKNQSLNWFFSLVIVLHYWFFYQSANGNWMRVSFYKHCHDNILFDIILKYSSQ